LAGFGRTVDRAAAKVFGPRCPLGGCPFVE
jgi:hypothetical protein